ncbi:RNA-binding domain-containing protein [uncultured Lamprocystis sp.]|jgi:ATP-dependent DNA helicase RecG|uniref:RNA-binding domain-containing protein n=1 Tax=uncultured Lamprocystis sp. TaxID=543132 RepID=UPI0025F8C89A|nr:RNA-binding domain-containing protein [uncultured Lamprocystis sp.]
MNQDDLLVRLRGFEWNDFECKKASRGVPDDAYKTVAAFANTAGGWLVFGVSEHNGQLEVTGVDEPDRVQNDFLSTLRSGQKLNQIIRIEEQRYSIDGKTVFVFHVPESPRFDKPIYLKGDPRQTYIRRGAGDEQCTARELGRFLRDHDMQSFDGELLADLDVQRCFDEDTVRWYKAQFLLRNPDQSDIADPVAFLHHWNYVTEQQGQMRPSRAGVLLFGKRQYVEQVLPRPVLDYQRIDTAFDNWSADQRWHDRYVFEENIFSTWRGLVARYMRIAEHPFSLDPTTLRRNDDPPDYVAFREAAINLLVHQDYGDPGRKAAIKLFNDRTIFWNPGDAFPATAALLEPTEKDVRNPALIKAFRRIGLSDQAGTGIRAIFRNWHELGRVPPQIRNDKASKEFELVLVNKPLLTVAMQRFRQSLGVDLSPEQADALALGLEKPAGESLSLTDIRGLGLSTTLQAKVLADRLVAQKLLESLSETRFQVPAPIRQRFDLATAQVTEQVGTKSGPSEDQVGIWTQLTAEQQGLLTKMHAEHAITELMDLVKRVNRTKFRDQCLTPLLEHGLVTMTIPDKPQSSKQRYRLTERGTAVLAGQQQKDKNP